MNTDFDIVVVGAGLTGAAAAALLARHAGLDAARIALLAEPSASAAAPTGAPQLRVVAVSRASEMVLKAAGAWSRLDERRLCRYERMQVWHESVAPESDAVLRFDAADIGEPDLGCIAENSALLAACSASFCEAGGKLIGTSLETLTRSEAAAQLRLADGRVVTARLVVGADGAESLVRTQTGLEARVRDYQQLAIVGTVRTERPHAHTAWQRFLSSGPLALLPLFEGSCSIVWSVERRLAQELLDSAVPEFNRRLTDASDRVLGAIELAGARASFPLQSRVSDSYIAARCALIGDAAHVIHPLAGQGANLGLLDAAALCEAVAAATARREDPGALGALRVYEQQRRTHNLIMDAAMSAFQDGFSGARGPGLWLLNRGLRLVNASTVLKRAFARQALGTSGELPRLARASAA